MMVATMPMALSTCASPASEEWVIAVGDSPYLYVDDSVSLVGRHLCANDFESEVYLLNALAERLLEIQSVLILKHYQRSITLCLPVHRADLKGQQRVELSRLVADPCTTAYVARAGISAARSSATAKTSADMCDRRGDIGSLWR
jgi:hypothetical protein